MTQRQLEEANVTSHSAGAKKLCPVKITNLITAKPKKNSLVLGLAGRAYPQCHSPAQAVQATADTNPQSGWTELPRRLYRACQSGR